MQWSMSRNLELLILRGQRGSREKILAGRPHREQRLTLSFSVNTPAVFLGHPCRTKATAPLRATYLGASSVTCDVGHGNAGGTALILAVRRSCCRSPRVKLPEV